MHRLLICAAALAALGTLSSSRPSRAEVEYPWCAVMTQGREGSVTSCGFVTEAQCESYINGIGGYCERNLRYAGPPRQPPRRRYHSDRDRGY